MTSLVSPESLSPEEPPEDDLPPAPAMPPRNWVPPQHADDRRSLLPAPPPKASGKTVNELAQEVRKAKAEMEEAQQVSYDANARAIAACSAYFEALEQYHRAADGFALGVR